MKINKLFTAGVLALAFGLILAGCSTDDDGGGVNNNGGNNNGTNNPFNATSWSGADYDGDSVTLSFTGSAWTLTYPDFAYIENGSYTYNGNVATFQFQGSAGTATISGNSLTVTVNGSTMMTLTRGSGNNNPGGGGGNNVVIILESNSPYGWQKTYEPASLLNGAKIAQGDVYTFTYSFTSNAAIDRLQVLLVDNAEATGWAWNVISNSTVIQQNIAANNVVSGSVTITATGTATDATPQANRLVFQAGTGTTSQPTLTFTTLKLEKGTGGGGGTTVPSAPTGVTASRNPAGSTTVTVSWNAVSGATGYKVYYSNTGSGSGSLEGSPSTTSFDSSGNSTTGTHYFRVSAVNSAGEGSPSSWVSVGPVSGGGGTAPSAPTGVTAARNPAGSTTVTISWNAVSGATSYKVYYSATGSGSGTLDGTSYTTSYDSANNSTTSTWYFRVTAVNSAGEGSPSSWVSVGPVSSGGGGTPNAPTGVTASRSPRSSEYVTVTWNAVSGATSYKIYSSSTATGTYQQTATATGSSREVYYYNDTTSYWKVSAVNDAGESALSSTYGTALGWQQGGTTVPSAPTGVTASRNPRSSEYVTVSWNAVSGATSYKIYSSSTATGTYQQTATATGSSREVFYYNDTTSYWKVSAVNDAGDSALSSTYGTALGWQQ